MTEREQKKKQESLTVNRLIDSREGTTHLLGRSVAHKENGVVGREAELVVSIALNSVSMEIQGGNFHNLQTYMEEASPLSFFFFPSLFAIEM